MKLIIQKLDGVIYAYREKEAHYRVVEKQRDASKRLPPENLDNWCDLTAYDDFYMVFDLLKPKKNPKKPKNPKKKDSKKKDSKKKDSKKKDSKKKDSKRKARS